MYDDEISIILVYSRLY